MGTRRSVSARPPASGSGLVRATGDAHDPLESEADRLLAATCQRLGMLGVLEDGGSDSEGREPSFDVRDDSKAGDVLYEMRKDLKHLVTVTDEMEQSYFAHRRKAFGGYRHLLMTDTVVQDMCILVKHLQHIVDPPMDLAIVLAALSTVGDNVQHQIHRMESSFPSFKNEGREVRHRDTTFDESRVPNWWEHEIPPSGEGGDEGGLVDKHGYPRDMKKAGFDRGAGGVGGTEPEREPAGSSPFEKGTDGETEATKSAMEYERARRAAEAGL
jgi:hypothetical protein